MKRYVKWITMLLAVVLIFGILAGYLSVSDPLAYLKNSAERSVKKALLGEILSVVFDAMQSGSFAFEFGGTDMVQGLPDAASLKLWLDADGQRMAADGDLVLSGESFGMYAVMTPDELVLKSPTFFASNTIGVNFQTLKEDLKTSIFSNNSGTKFADSDVSVDTADKVKDLRKDLFTLLSMIPDGVDFFDEVSDVFLDQLTQNASNAKYREDGRNYVSLSVNNDALSRALRGTRAKLVDDRSFCKDLRKAAATLDSMRSAKTGVASNEYSAEVEYFIHSEEYINLLCHSIDTAEAFVFDLNAVIVRFGMRLESLNVSFTQAGITLLQAELLMAQKNGTGKLSVYYDGTLRALNWQVEEDNRHTYAVALSYEKSVNGLKTLTVEGELQANKRDGTYTLLLSKGAETRIFGGDYCFDRDEVMLSVNSASLNGVSQKLSLRLCVKAGEKVPRPEEYVNVISMDVARYDPISVYATEAKERLDSAIESSGITPQSALAQLLHIVGLPEEIPSEPAPIA